MAKLNFRRADSSTAVTTSALVTVETLSTTFTTSTGLTTLSNDGTPTATWALVSTETSVITSTITTGSTTIFVPVGPSGISPTATASSTTALPTTASTTSTPTHAVSAVSTNTNGVRTGAAAGIGIGCAIVGALVGGLIVLFLLSRRRRRQQNQPEDIVRDNGGYSRQEKAGITTTVTNVDRFLPQPTEDDAIVSALSKIRDGIKNHVQNYYHKAPVDPQLVDETQEPLVQLAGALAIPTRAISDLLLNPSTRLPTIRLFLAHFILSRCSGQADGSQSFLPTEVSALSALYPEERSITPGTYSLLKPRETMLTPRHQPRLCF